MPELPEVEHVVRALSRAVLGRRILATEIKLKRLLAGSSLTSLKRQLRGARIETIRRRGKYIVIEFDNQQLLLVHLRMTGKFVCLGADMPLPPYAHAVFYRDDDRRLVFCDMRQFGRMRILRASRVETSCELRSLAPEPLSYSFNIDYFYSVVARSQRTLK